MIIAHYKTKALLKAAIGKPFKGHEPSHPGAAQYKETGTITVTGPSEYEHKWYARVELEKGLIKKVLNS